MNIAGGMVQWSTLLDAKRAFRNCVGSIPGLDIVKPLYNEIVLGWKNYELPE